MKNSFTTKRLREVAQLRMGETLVKKDLTGDGVPVYSADSLEKPWGFTSKNKLEFTRGAIIVGARGTLGSVKLPDNVRFTSTQTTIILGPQRKIISPPFLFYYLRVVDFKKLRGGSGIPMLTVGRLNDLEIPLPPLPIQQKIVKILDAIQEAVEAQEKIIVKTKELKKSLMAEIFNSKIPEGEPSAPYGASKNQKSKLQFKIKKWIRLDEIAKIERGKFAHRPRNDPAYYGGGIPFVQTGDVSLSNGHIKKYHQTLNKKGLSVSRVFPRGTIVITIAANIGYSAILDFDSAFPDSLIGITPNKEIDSEFLNYYLSSQQEKMDEIAARGTQKNINIEFLKPWPIPSLSLNKQREIAEILQTIDQKIEIEQKKKALYEELFKTMLNKLMNREIEIDELKI